MNTEYRANKRLCEFTEKKGGGTRIKGAGKRRSKREREGEREGDRTSGGKETGGGYGRRENEDREDGNTCREPRRKIAPAPTGILTFNNKARESRVVTL